MFDSYSPLKDRLFRVMDNNGKIVNPKWKPDIPDSQVLDSYTFMHFARTADLMAVSYQRQGRMYTYPPNLGQEAIAVATGFVMKKEDWLVPAFREMAAWLAKGAKLSDIFLFWGGNEEGSLFSGAPNFLPSAVPIASQLPHAVGIGFALKYKKKKGTVFAFVGDGGTSQGDFHEALNFASVWKVPVVFIVQNNQYAISVPISQQTASKNLAVKSIAYGMPGIRVDGNDFFAMVAALQQSIEHVSAGHGPVLIEAVTFRMGAHTTSDDPTLYRTEDEEKTWQKKDPLKRLRNYLEARQMWTKKDDEALQIKHKKEVEAAFARYENHPDYLLEDVFRFTYGELPEDLHRQRVEVEKYLNWKEAQHEGHEHGSSHK